MKQELEIKRTAIDFTNDSIVVRKFQNGILGGVMLDYAGYPLNHILAGHCVITDGNGNYKPMPIKGETYDAMPQGFHYAGVVYRSAKITEPVSVMTRGVVNREKAPYYFRSDFDLADIIITVDLDEADPYIGYATITEPSQLAEEGGKDVRIASDDAANGLTASMPYFKNVLMTNVEVNQTVTVKATEKITFDNITIAGEKGVSNGKITYAAKTVELKNITAKDGSTLYNAFEGYQSTTDDNYSGLQKMCAENLDIDCPSLTHNIINVYTPANGAEIVVKNSKFNLTVDNSNALRLSNYLNAENVTVTFENCDWTYENGVSFNDWSWAGLVIYQPASADIALNGDLSKIQTWTFVFKNCRYNGEKVTENNFGEHNQVLYLYNVGRNNKVDDPNGLNIVFE